MQFTHEQGRKEKTIFPPLLCSCYPLTMHFSMMLCNTFEFEDRGNTLWLGASPLLLARSVLQHNPEGESLDESPGRRFNTQDLSLIRHMFTFSIPNGQKLNRTELGRVGKPARCSSMMRRRKREFLIKCQHAAARRAAEPAASL